MQHLAVLKLKNTGKGSILLFVGPPGVGKTSLGQSIAKALVGASRFEALLSEAKGDALEGRKATKNPTARLIFRLMETISEPRQSRGPKAS